MLSRLSGAQTIWGPHFAKHGKAAVSCSGLPCLPVNEQELGQTAQQVIQCQAYASLSLWCCVECSHALFKWQELLAHYTHFLLMQKYHIRWPHAKHREKLFSGNSHLGKQFSEDALGSPGSPRVPMEVWEVKTIFTKTLRRHLTCSLSFSLKCMVEISRRHMTWDMATDWMHKQIRGSNHLSLSWMLKKFAAKYSKDTSC